MNNVLTIRNGLKMTQDEFAEYCDMARASIARYEAGGNLSRSAAQKIATACHVSISYVLGINEDTDRGSLKLSLAEEALIRDYRTLSPDGQAYIRQTMAMAINTMGQNETVSVVGAG